MLKFIDLVGNWQISRRIQLNLIPGVFIVVVNLKNGSTKQRRISVN